jgi:hypothetical protein
MQHGYLFFTGSLSPFNRSLIELNSFSSSTTKNAAVLALVASALHRVDGALLLRSPNIAKCLEPDVVTPTLA